MWYFSVGKHKLVPQGPVGYRFCLVNKIKQWKYKPFLQLGLPQVAQYIGWQAKCSVWLFPGVIAY
mgnify:CR=1 FL=1